MTDTTKVGAPVVVEEKPRRRRAAGIISSAALGTALLAGLTLAAFTDSEFAGLNHDGADEPGYGVASYNIQIRSNEGDEWHDTTMLEGHASDNLGDDIHDPITLLISNADKIIPNDPDSYPTVSFDVRNDQKSTVNSSIHFRLLNGASEPLVTSPELLAALRFDVTITGGTLEGSTKFENQTFTDLSQEGAPIEVTTSAAPEEVFTITITVKLPVGEISAADKSAFQNTHAYLIAAVYGESVAA
ncbi:MAG: hypothetical protein LBL55_10220 [Propionibacteriaceae bacterium]|jgi:hypothetical protein|nr:hypothetical protein [Propionibacteriaceae bacterium]